MSVSKNNDCRARQRRQGADNEPVCQMMQGGSGIYLAQATAGDSGLADTILIGV